jgi:hypothetical protein
MECVSNMSSVVADSHVLIRMHDVIDVIDVDVPYAGRLRRWAWWKPLEGRLGLA